MINVNWSQLVGGVEGLAKAYANLPGHIAKKHLLACMKRAVVKSGGVKLLRQNTPPTGTRRGRRKKGEKAKSTGELRKSVMAKARWIGTNTGGVAVAGLGYRYGWNSRKAIWKEYGTTWQKGEHMMRDTYNSIRDQVASQLATELAAALEKAHGEVKGNQNKGYGG